MVKMHRPDQMVQMKHNSIAVLLVLFSSTLCISESEFGKNCTSLRLFAQLATLSSVPEPLCKKHLDKNLKPIDRTMKLKIIAKIIAKTFALVFRRLHSYITAAIRAPQQKSTHTPKGRRLVCSKMLQISKHIDSVEIKKKTSSRQAPLSVKEREKNHI